MTSYNAPCRIGQGVCLPGDIVMGTESGVFFIPSHLVAEVINSAENPRKRYFRICDAEKGIYTTAQIDSSVWSMDMLKAMQEFIEKDERCQKYRNLDWSLEIRAAQGEKEALEEVLKTCLV